jgi:hypothetical protein
MPRNDDVKDTIEEHLEFLLLHRVYYVVDIKKKTDGQRACRPSRRHPAHVTPAEYTLSLEVGRFECW